MIGVGGVGLVLINQNIATIISRNEPTYINIQYIRNEIKLLSKLNIVYLIFGGSMKSISTNLVCVPPITKVMIMRGDLIIH